MSAQDSKLFVISGPSGAGKGTLVTRVRERRSNLGLTVSATTRAPRKGEVDGVNYFFLTREEFDRRVANGEFVEVLRERLVGRGTETPETIELRMANAADELALADLYDDVVVNDDLDRATDELVRVLDMHERI